MPQSLIEQLELAHKHSSHHRDAVLASAVCGCFCCLEKYAPTDIEDWIDEPDDVAVTALCPRCGCDAVIGSESGVPLDQPFLEQMHEYWFNRAWNPRFTL